MSSPVVEYIKTFEEFNEIIAKDEPSIIDFTASWCGPCKAIAPLYENMAKENPGVKFYKLDVDDVGEAAQAAEVRAMPTFILYRKGEKQANPVRGANPPGIQGLVTFAKTLA